MRLSNSLIALIHLTVISFTLVKSTTWTLNDTIAPSDFESTFDWFNETDPTNGLVLYQTLAQAQAANLSYVSQDQFFMAVDTTEVQLAGRKSIRISSKKSYQDGIYVLNVSHVPTGCATNPAFWTVTENLANYPLGGEIDIIENADDAFPGALSSLHTSTSCVIPNNTNAQSGIVQFTNCSYYNDGNTGCRTQLPSSSYGTKLNQAGGGTYAMERSLGSTGNGVRVWFWSKGSEPSDLIPGSNSVDPSTWGTPGADFDLTKSCYSDFGPHKITFDITLCDDFALNNYTPSGCGSQYPACSFQVGYNGTSFNQSYWAINSLRIFASGGGTDNSANSPVNNASSGSSSSSSTSSSSSGTKSSTSSALQSVHWIPTFTIIAILIVTLALFTTA